MVNALENVLLPSVLNPFQVDGGAKLIFLGNLRNLHSYFHRAGALKRNNARRKVAPVLELPLHLDLSVFLETHKFALDGPIVNHVLATRFRLYHARSLRELATAHLVRQNAVDYLGRTVVFHVDLGRLHI